MPALAGDLATLKQMTSLAALGIQAAAAGCGFGGAVVEFTRDSVHRRRRPGNGGERKEKKEEEKDEEAMQR